VTVAAGRWWAARRLTLIVAACTLALDQLTKWWAVNALDDRNIDLFWTIRFNLTFNSGMAFGKGKGAGAIIGVIALVVIVVLLLSIEKSTTSTLARIAMGGIIGGALGNVSDRVFRSGGGFLRGAVVDFIDVQWWPVFNVADVGVTVGGVLLVLTSLWTTEHAPVKQSAS